MNSHRVIHHQSHIQDDSKSKHEKKPQGTMIEPIMERRGLTSLIRDPLHLKLLILAGTELNPLELPQITACCNLMKLDISSNGLENIPITMDFGRFSNLKLLYLHNNRLSDMESLTSVFRCHQLTYLTIFRNPISELSSIRHYVINSMPSLKCLDFDFVLDSERDSQLRVHRQYFSMKSKLAWPIMVYPSDENLTESAFLSILHREIQIVTETHASCSYVLTIQRFIRGFLVRRRVLRVLTHAHNKENSIIKFAAKWKQYVVKRRELKQLLEERKKLYLLEDTKVYRHMSSMNKLSKLVGEFKKRMAHKKQSQRAARTLIRVLKSKISFSSSFESYFALDNNSTPNRLYIRKDQIRFFDSEEFKYIMNQYATDSKEFKDPVLHFTSNLRSHIQHSHPFQILRVPDNASIDLPTNPLVQLIKPSISCKLIIRKNCEKNKNAIYYFTDAFRTHPVLVHIERSIDLRQGKQANRYHLDQHDRMRVDDRIKRIKRFQEDSQDQLVSVHFAHPKILSYFLRAVVYLNSISESKKEPPNLEQLSSQLNSQQPLQQISGLRNILGDNWPHPQGQEPSQVIHAGQSTPNEQLEEDSKELFNKNNSETNIICEQNQQDEKCIDYYESRRSSLPSNHGMESDRSNDVLANAPPRKWNPTSELKNNSTVPTPTKEKLLVFFHSELIRVSAVMKIQQVWRQFVLKKLMIKAKMNPFKQLAAHHSIRRIQRWVRQLAYAHKTNFMKEIYHYLQSLVIFNHRSLLIHEQIYMNLNQYVVRSTCYYPFRSALTQMFAFREASATILFNKTANAVMLRNIEHAHIPRVFPQFIEDVCAKHGESGQNYSKKQLNTNNSYSDTAYEEFVDGDIYHILHLGASVSRVTVDSMNYVSFSYATLGDALYRTAILALKTYCFRMNGSYVQLMPMPLVQELKYVVAYEEKLSQAFRRPVRSISGLPLQKGHKKGPVNYSKPIDNKHSLFIVSDIVLDQVFQTNRGIAELSNYASKQIHMFSQSHNNQHPTKIVTALKYFCLDNIYMKVESEATNRVKHTATPAANINPDNTSSIIISSSNINSISTSAQANNDPMKDVQTRQKEKVSSFKQQNLKLETSSLNFLNEESKNEVLPPKYLSVKQSNDSPKGAAGTDTVNNSLQSNPLSLRKNTFSSVVQSRNNSIGVTHNSNQVGSTSHCSTGVNASPMNFYAETTTKESILSRRAYIKQQDMQFATSLPTPDDHDFCFDFPSIEAQEKFLSYRQSGLSFGRPSRSNSNCTSQLQHQNPNRGPATAGASTAGRNNSPDFNDPRNVSKLIHEREKTSQDLHRKKVEEEKDRRFHVKEMNSRLQEAQAFERVTHVKAMRQNFEIQREGDHRVDMVLKTQQILRIRQPAQIVGSSEDSHVENTMMKNVNFLSKQITSFQRKKHALELAEKKRVRVKQIKEEKTGFVAGQLHPIQQYEVLRNREISHTFFEYRNISSAVSSSSRQLESSMSGIGGNPLAQSQQQQVRKRSQLRQRRFSQQSQEIGSMDIEGTQSNGIVHTTNGSRLPLIEPNKARTSSLADYQIPIESVLEQESKQQQQLQRFPPTVTPSAQINASRNQPKNSQAKENRMRSAGHSLPVKTSQLSQHEEGEEIYLQRNQLARIPFKNDNNLIKEIQIDQDHNTSVGQSIFTSLPQGGGIGLSIARK